MPNVIPPSRQALEESLALSGEILRNIELNEIPLANIALKASRLARLLNEFDMQKTMEYEAGGYPKTSDGISPDVWQLVIAAGRTFKRKDSKTNETREYGYTESIGELETQPQIAETSLAAARDPDVAITSANPYQYVYSSMGNLRERITIRQSIQQTSERLANRRAFIHQFALRKHYELKYSAIVDDVFARIRDRVDGAIGQIVPDAVQRLTAIYDNLRSENPEDWSNAVHSCRRILKDLADAVFPPADEERSVEVEGKTKTIKLGADNYINRIMAFVQDRSSSKRFQDLVGSHLRFLGDRLDSVVNAAQKGSHATIVNKEEADRYVVFTYLLVGDILSLQESPDEST